LVSTNSISSSISPQFNYFDEGYQNKNNQLQLFLQISRHELLLTKFDEANKKYLAFQNFDFNENEDWNSIQRKLEKILPKDDFQECKKLNICFSDPLYTLVPKALFEESKLETYLSFNHAIEDVQQLRFYSDLIESFDAVVVYALPRGLEFLAKAKLPNFKWHHFSFALLEAISLEKDNFSKLNINIQRGRFDVIYAPNGKLTFFNSFNYRTSEDFIYFLLYVMEQLHLDRESCTIKLTGEIESNSAIYELLHQYIRTVEIGNRPTDVNFSAVLSEIPEHYYFNLFNQHLCG